MNIKFLVDKSNWYLHRVFNPMDQCSWTWNIFYKLPKEKYKHQPSYNLTIYNGDLSASYAIV